MALQLWIVLIHPLFIAQFYLLTTPRPVGRILSYIAGVLVVNFGGGLLILGGVRVLIAEALSSIEGSTSNYLQLVLGIAVLAFGLWYKATPQIPAETKKPRSNNLIHAFALGMVVMVNELTTALPYFVAIEQIAQAKLTTILNILSLIGYNVVFSLPLFAFLGLFLFFQQRFTLYIERINAWMQIWVSSLGEDFFYWDRGIVKPERRCLPFGLQRLIKHYLLRSHSFSKLLLLQ